MVENRIEIADLETIILCGGMGSRLGYLTENTQKCILNMCGKPFLQYIIDQLKSFGIRKFIFATGKNSEQIKNLFSNIGIISKEEEPLGTGGAISNALRHIKNNHFMVINGDSYCNLSKEDFNRFVISYTGRPLIMSTHVKNSILASHIKTNYNKYHGAGFYIFPKTSFKNVPYKCSLEHDLLPMFLNKEYFLLKECWLVDIGTKKNLEKAEEVMETLWKKHSLI